MFGRVKEAWDAGKDHEIGWWLNHLRATIGADQDFLARARGETRFTFDSLVKPSSAPIKVLDVGAGPVTQVGRQHDAMEIDVTAIDPLAHDYDKILAEVGIVPIVRTLYGEAEHLDQLFAPDTFDFAYCRNALDHSYHPIEGVWQTIRVLKPGAKFFLCGYTDEGVEAEYLGLHQWNFDVRDGALIVWRPGVTINVAEALQGDVEITEARADQRWYMVTFTKPNA